jgi:hypothetical protein
MEGVQGERMLGAGDRDCVEGQVERVSKCLHSLDGVALRWQRWQEIGQIWVKIPNWAMDHDIYNAIGTRILLVTRRTRYNSDEEFYTSKVDPKPSISNAYPGIIPHPSPSTHPKLCYESRYLN